MTAVAPGINLADVAHMAACLARNCGYAVFPCLETKAPATRHGVKDATSNPDRVDWLWRRFPGPLIGVATGEASGIDVLDVDLGHEAARFFQLSRQSERHDRKAQSAYAARRVASTADARRR